MNSLSYTEKLSREFSENVRFAMRAGVLEEQVAWLRKFLTANYINVRNFLIFLQTFFSTSHMIVEPLNTPESREQAYLRSLDRSMDKKKNCLFIYGKSKGRFRWLQGYAWVTKLVSGPLLCTLWPSPFRPGSLAQALWPRPFGSLPQVLWPFTPGSFAQAKKLLALVLISLLSRITLTFR